MVEYIVWSILILVGIAFLILLMRWNNKRRIDKLWNETCAYAHFHHLDQELLKRKSLETIKNFCDAQFQHKYMTAEVKIKMGELKDMAEHLSKWWTV